ncbi:MAG: TetR/AcrR family transcriptional regulator [Solirubrobacteraceae bacterium]|nr:TetR/AcrR family transcriptional regulator [Solirubrobacteraceae bacterium]
MPSVTRKRQGSRAERRDEMRGRLLAVVERLLGEGESFTEISVERLVSEAGISRSTFYVYFEDKGDLLSAWFGDITSEIAAAAAGWWQLGPDVTRDAVHEALDRVVRTYRPHTTLMAAMYDTASYDAGVRDLTDAMMTSNVAGLRKHIRTGQQQGFITERLNAEETAAWLTWMAERGFHRLVRAASDEDVDRLIDAYTDIVWFTLYAPAASGA